MTTATTTTAPPEAPATAADPFLFGGRAFASRLIVGTGKYPTFALMKDALEASRSEIVTVAVRRVNLTDRSKESLLDFVDTLWSAEGGFHGNWTDDDLDLEYTYYGLLALGHLAL